MRSLSVALAMVLAMVATTESPLEEPFPIYTGDEFKALYDHAVRHELPNLVPPSGRLPVTGDPDLDDRIWDIATARGYVLRPVAGPDLGSADGVPMQPQAAAAWEQLKEAARAAGHPFVVSSAYRSPDSQRTQFNSKLRGTTDEAIDAALTWYSIPGTSKHHGGYALDFRYADGTFGEFRDTPDYAWLATDNFLNAKRFGFIPSYPDDVTTQGPNPEPWEFVWVGVDLIRCGMPCVEAASGPLARHPGGQAPIEFALDRNARRRHWGPLAIIG
ncbi:MAG TPA: M15 family metallopeptidase [Acidimicrobiia bacterium]|nr:M15 family metallopeptidase [Acidimicrobiia bacterium]